MDDIFSLHNISNFDVNDVIKLKQIAQINSILQM